MTKAEFDLTNKALTSAVSNTAVFCMGVVSSMAWADGLAVDGSLLEDCNEADLALGHSTTLEAIDQFCEKLYSSWKEFR